MQTSQQRKNAMDYATLGNTGLLVSKLCFGTMTFGDGRGLFKGLSTVGQAGADELVKTSIDGGINFFDTADNYTEGESETILGQSLKNINIARKDVVIATKVYSRVGAGRNDIGASRGHIMDAVEASLRRLQTDHIDLYQARNASTTFRTISRRSNSHSPRTSLGSWMRSALLPLSIQGGRCRSREPRACRQSVRERRA